MTEAFILDGMRVPVEPGSPSRRARLTIERDGSLRLMAANDIERAELEAFLTSKREWIYKKLAEKEELRFEPIRKEFVDGEGFQYLGRSHRLEILRTSNPRVHMSHGRLVLPSALRCAAREQIISWYEARALAWVQPRLGGWASRLRVNPGALEVADLGYKWGAATPGGRIRLHWATMQLSPTLIDYVLAHELAHLREPHHGPAFWALVWRVMPDCDERKGALAKTGSRLWLGDESKRGAIS